MNREYWKRLLPIIQAFADGKEIEIETSINKWIIKKDPNFGCDALTYRIKPEPKIVPFTFEDDLVGKVVIGKSQLFKEIKSIINGQGENNVKVSGSDWMTYEDLLNTCTFLDGSPCGKVINENN